MSRENVEIVRRAYEAFNQGDLEGLLDFVDPEIEVQPDLGLPGWRVFEGREGLLSFAETWLDRRRATASSPRSWWDAGDRVMAITRESGRTSETGSEVA